MFIYSLFRSETQDVAEEKFIVYQEKIPLYITATKEVSVFFYLCLFYLHTYCRHMGKSTYIITYNVWYCMLF